MHDRETLPVTEQEPAKEITKAQEPKSGKLITKPTPEELKNDGVVYSKGRDGESIESKVLNKVGKSGEIISKETIKSGKTITVLGSLKDTAQYAEEKGFNVLPANGWTLEKNKKFVEDALKRGDEIWIVTNPYKHEKLSRSKGFRSEFIETEIPLLEKHGYDVYKKFKK